MKKTSGIAIVVDGADFSNKGLGNIFFTNQYISKGNIIDAAIIAALSEFEDGLRTYSLINKFSVMRLFTGSANSDKLNFVSPNENVATFSNDSTNLHTKSLGYTMNSTELQYISDSGCLVPLPIDTLHIHAFNTTPVNQDTTRVLISASSTNNLLCEIRRNQSNRTRGIIGQYTPLSGETVSAPIGYNTSNTGLISVVRQSIGSGNITLYDNGIQIGQTSVPSFEGNVPDTVKIHEGHRNNASIPDCSFRLFAYGSGEWTINNETDFNSLCVELNNKMKT